MNYISDLFPLLKNEVNKNKLIYFDNGATTQKPKIVIDAINEYYNKYNANIHRGNHYLSALSTSMYEESRQVVANFINAKSHKEVIFTYGTTDSINMLATILSKKMINKGDEILISNIEHHANIVPWQEVCLDKDSVLKIIPILDNGNLDYEKIPELITEKTKILSISHISNTTGIINDIERVIKIARKINPKIIISIDAAQSIAHIPIDVQALDIDFISFSGHKMFSSTGSGVLWGKEELLNTLPPYRFGGEMIDYVSFEKTTYNEIPLKFETGTPNIESIITLKKAIEFINNFGFDKIEKIENELKDYMQEKLQNIENLRIIGNSINKIPTFSFVIDGISNFDLGILLDKQGIATRIGHHCTQPLMRRFGVEGTIRASLSIYNTKEEIDIFINALNISIQMLS